MNLFKDKCGTLDYDSTVPCITATFLHFMTSEIFRNFLEKGLQFLAEKKTANEPILWLADTKKHSVQSADDLKWVADSWNPRALSIGVRYVAFVLPDNVFGEASVKNYSNISKKRDDSKIEIEMFSSVDQAKDWFREIVKAHKEA